VFFLSIGAVVFITGIVTAGPVLVRYASIALDRLLQTWRAGESQIAGANLVRQSERTSITASTVMISMAILVVMGGMTTTLTSGYRNYLDKSMHADFYLLPQSILLGHGNVGAGPELSKRLRENPGVSSFTALRYGETAYKKLPLRIIGINPKTYPNVAGMLFSEGGPDKSYKPLDEGRSMIVNGPMAAKNNLKTGDAIMIDTPAGLRSYRIVGIGLDYMNFKLATAYISHINLAADFFEHSDQLFMIDKKKGADGSALATSLLKIVKDYPAFSLMSGAVWQKSQVKIFNISRYTLYTLMLILALPSLIALANTLGINVLERIREIGMLRAIGTTRIQIMRLIISESLFLTAMGLAVGVPAGIWFGYITVYASNLSGFVFEYFFPVAGIIITVIIGLLFGTAAAVFPARQAARLNIVTALHYE
jgi:putative ABC transport system permease protein